MPTFDRNRIKQDFNRAAATYDTHALLQRRVADTLFSRLKEAQPVNNRVLDAGCGTGYFHELARKYGHRWNITQLDMAFNMCQVAAGYASPPDYGGTYTVSGDIESLPFPDNHFGAVFSSLTVQWSNHLDKALAEMCRVLAPGGTAFISTLAPGTLHELAEAFTACGFHSPVSPFRDEKEVMASLPSAVEKQGEIVPLTLYYPSLLSLMRSLKALGAQHKHPVKNPYLGKKGLQKIETCYRLNYGDSNSLPVTWNVFYLVIRKP